MHWLRSMRWLRCSWVLLAAGAAGAVVPLTTAGCGSEEADGSTATNDAGTDGDSTGGDGGEGGQPSKEETVTLRPDQPPLPGETECTVVITTGIAIPDAMHVPLCTPVTYATNPPSGGPHWPKWATFKKYDVPVPREMYVHDLEHGAVVLAYRCDEPCPDVVDFLGTAFDEFALDPLCVTGGGTNRLILTPDPDLDAPVAAAAWGATYVATCLDRASLDDFMEGRYGKGTESVCAQGVPIDAPDAGIGCDGG
jgi:hypothetical protein